MVKDVTRRLRFSNDDAEQIVALVANHMRFKDVEQMRASTLKRFVRLPRFEEHMELHRLDCLSSNRKLESYGFVRRTLAETPAEQIRPPRLLTGEDLLSMGYKPGPLFSKILRAVEDAQLEGEIKTEEEAKEYVQRRLEGKTKRELAQKRSR
jgi:tRNA nucleotidyltransferase/poly(A) polymerase